MSMIINKVGQRVPGNSVTILPQIDLEKPPVGEFYSVPFPTAELVTHSVEIIAGGASFQGLLILPSNVTIQQAMDGGVQ